MGQCYDYGCCEFVVADFLIGNYGHLGKGSRRLRPDERLLQT